MIVALFEDERVVQLYPVTVGKPACAVSCGSYRLLDLVGPLGQSLVLLVCPHWRDTLRADQLAVSLPNDSASTLFLNARLRRWRCWRRSPPCLPPTNRPCCGAARLCCCAGARGFVSERTGIGSVQVTHTLSNLPLPAVESDLPLFDYPHDIVRFHLSSLRSNLEHRLSGGNFEEIAAGVFAAAGAKLGPYVVTNTDAGPILLEGEASVGPYCYLSGPAYLGAGGESSSIRPSKDGVSLGHTTKIGGEVEASIIEPYTNKQHHGFLGHSYLGSWVNLGAGTCNSDLKNTYGQVNMEYQGQKVATGMQFIGSDRRRLCQDGHQHRHLHRQNGRKLQYGVWVRHDQRAELGQLRAQASAQVTEAPVEVMVATQGGCSRGAVENNGPATFNSYTICTN